jgi:hypothetical protein
MLRLAIVLGYIVAVALIAIALAADSGEVAGLGFIAFGIMSLGFGYAFLRYAHWRCWKCLSRNPARAATCAGCGTTREEGDRLAAQQANGEALSRASCKAFPMARRALFVFDRENWCYVFSDVTEVSGQLETNDVEADEYVVFDQVGTVFEIWAEGVDVRLRPTDKRDRAQLHERLARFRDKSHVKCASEDVIDIGNAILEAEWESRWPKRPRWLATRLHGDAPPTL